jgi:tellurite resistance protein
MSQPTTHSKLEHFPITLLPSVMGLAGLAIVYLKFQHLFGISLPIGQGILLGVSIWFAFLMGMQTVRFIRYRDAVLKDFAHPVRVNFFPAISISLLLLSIGYQETGHLELAKVLWYIATPMHLILLLKILHDWFYNTYHINSFNPAWFIPVVGPLLVPIAGVKILGPEISWFFYATGLLFWIVLLAVLINRILFHHPMPQKLIPTLFILIAPPAVGFISYIKLTHNLDPFARIMFYFGVFTFLMLLTMIAQFRKVPFFLSWWAYTFPLDAFTISLFLMYKISGYQLYRQGAFVMTIVTTLTIIVVLIKTVRLAARGGICVPED